MTHIFLVAQRPVPQPSILHHKEEHTGTGAILGLSYVNSCRPPSSGTHRTAYFPSCQRAIQSLRRTRGAQSIVQAALMHNFITGKPKKRSKPAGRRSAESAWGK
jgi:hypothetical protein